MPFQVLWQFRLAAPGMTRLVCQGTWQQPLLPQQGATLWFTPAIGLATHLLGLD